MDFALGLRAQVTSTQEFRDIDPTRAGFTRHDDGLLPLMDILRLNFRHARFIWGQFDNTSRTGCLLVQGGQRPPSQPLELVDDGPISRA